MLGRDHAADRLHDVLVTHHMLKLVVVPVIALEHREIDVDPHLLGAPVLVLIDADMCRHDHVPHKDMPQACALVGKRRA